MLLGTVPFANADVIIGDTVGISGTYIDGLFGDPLAVAPASPPGAAVASTAEFFGASLVGDSMSFDWVPGPGDGTFTILVTITTTFGITQTTAATFFDFSDTTEIADFLSVTWTSSDYADPGVFVSDVDTITVPSGSFLASGSYTLTITTAAVPEPSGIALALLCLLGIGIRRRAA